MKILPLCLIYSLDKCISTITVKEIILAALTLEESGTIMNSEALTTGITSTPLFVGLKIQDCGC